MSNNGNIFKLYRKEKTIEFDDGSGNTASILMTKPNQTESDLINDYYLEKVEAATENLMKTTAKVIGEKAKALSKADLIKSIIEIEKVKVIQDKDLSTELFKAEGKKTDAEVKKDEDKAVTQWEKERKEILGKMDKPLLVQVFSNYIVSSMAISNSMSDFDNVSLCYVCHPPDKPKEYLFSSNPKDANFIGILAPEVVQKLVDELNEFIISKGQRELRELAENPDFSQTTGSEKP